MVKAKYSKLTYKIKNMYMYVVDISSPIMSGVNVFSNSNDAETFIEDLQWELAKYSIDLRYAVNESKAVKKILKNYKEATIYFSKLENHQIYVRQ